MEQNPPANARVYYVEVNCEQRPFIVVAENHGSPMPVDLVTADSMCFELFNGNTSDIRYTKMGDVNGVNAVAKQIGAVAVHLLYKRRWSGLVSGPNIYGGMLRYDNTADDDLDYVRRVMAKVERMFGPGRRVFVGFSIGAQFGLIALNRTPRLFTDFISASGTCIGTEGVTRADVSLVQFYGEEDERFPWEGGFSNNRLTRFLERRLPLLDPRAANSDPHSLERGFAEANGYGRRPVEKPVAGGIAYRKQYNPPGAKPIVVSYYVCGPGLGGHTYHGPAAPEVFSVNERFVAELGLMPA